MMQASLVLLAVATELAEMAKNNLPALRKREVIRREWFKNAVLYRETDLNGRKFISRFDFRKRESCRSLVKRGNENV